MLSRALLHIRIMHVSQVVISTGTMSNRTVLDTTEPYSNEQTPAEDVYPLSFQV